MRKYQNILVIIEPQLEEQLALNRAMEITRFSKDTKVTALLAIYDYSYEITAALNLNDQQEMKNTIIENHRIWLEKELDEIRQKYPLLESKIVWQRNIAAAILNEARKGEYDLIIKSSESHSFLDSVLFTPLDWQLLRRSEIPVLIAKDHDWPENANIVVAINFDDNEEQEQRLMNIKLLRNAQELATLINGKIHLVNAAIPIMPATVIEIPGFTPEIYTEAIIKYNWDKLEIFSNKHKIPMEQCYVIEGQPDDVIPKKAAELNACAVLIGNFARKGWNAALIGNTCENIIDDINCDLLVIKH